MSKKGKIPKTNFHRHWERVLGLTTIPIERQNELVPYSLRHYTSSTALLINSSFTSMYLCVVAIDECPTASDSKYRKICCLYSHKSII